MIVTSFQCTIELNLNLFIVFIKNSILKVRGVGAGGIVSTAFCLLYKLYTLRLTRKQVNGLLTHTDSPFIRALGFMYIRYTQPPGDLFDWYEPYLQDEEEIDPKAGGGQVKDKIITKFFELFQTV